MANDPGSKEAIAQGCTCSARENRNGLGVKRLDGGRMFFPDHDCPLHGLIAAAAAVERGEADVIDMTPEEDVSRS